MIYFTLQEIAKELFDTKEYAYQWKKNLRNRFKQDNGLYWVKQFRIMYDTEKVFRQVKRSSTQTEIEEILKRSKKQIPLAELTLKFQAINKN